MSIDNKLYTLDGKQYALIDGVLTPLQDGTASKSKQQAKESKTTTTIYSVSISKNGKYFTSLPTLTVKTSALKIYNVYKSLDIYKVVKLSSAVVTDGTKVKASDWVNVTSHEVK